MTTTPATAERLTLFDRVTSLLVWLAISVGLASLAALAFRDDGRIPLLCLLLGVAVGLLNGVTGPFGIRVAEVPPGPVAVPGEPVPLGALGHRAVQALERPMVKAMQIAAIVCLAPPAAAFGLYVLLGERPSLFVLGGVTIVSLVAATACATILPPFFLDERTRTAFAVSVWAGARESVRAFGSRRASGNVPLTDEDRRRWLDGVQNDAARAVDVQVMVMASEFDAAREAVQKLPETTAYERYVKAEHEALVRYQETGDPDRSAVGRALAAMPPGPDRLEAVASNAVGEARLLLPDGDWRLPLLAVRDSIPESDARILVRDHGLVIFAIRLAALRRVLLVLAGLTIALGSLQLYLV